MIRIALSIVVLTVVAAGCGKKKYPASCSKAVELTAPWTDFDFPKDEGRVCESGSGSVKYMFLGGNEEELKKKFEDAAVAKGFTKDKCSSLACEYKNDTEQVSVQPFVATGKNKYVTVSVRIRKRIGK